VKRIDGACCRNTWRRLTRLGCIAALGFLVIVSSAAPALSRPAGSLVIASWGAQAGSGVRLAPPRQIEADTSDPETETGSTAESRASDMATTVAILHRQGEQGAENLARVSGIAVPNLMVVTEPPFDAAAQQIAVANAAATATAVAATAVERSVQATVEAQATSAAVEAAALAATQAAQSQAEATAAARATQTAKATVAADAARIAASVSATMEADRLALAATAVPVAENAPIRLSPLLIALIPLFGGLFGVAFWRARKEPFVLKANPVNASASA
jgi:hypothetical protein